MGKKQLTTTAFSEPAVNTATNTTAQAGDARRALENFLVIWLDANLDESKEDYKKLIEHLRENAVTVTTFTDVDQCVDFLSDIQDEKIFMIVSGTLGQYLIPEIQACPQLKSIYVFCDNQSIHEPWAKTISKVKGVYTQIEQIGETLQTDCKHCDRSMISISFRGIDPLFMYTQLLKEALLEIDDHDTKSIKELADYCRIQKAASELTLEKLEKEYRNHTSIWWYTGPYFIYSMLNHGLRLMDVEVILKLGFFIRHLHQYGYSCNIIIAVFTLRLILFSNYSLLFLTQNKTKIKWHDSGPDKNRPVFNTIVIDFYDVC